MLNTLYTNANGNSYTFNGMPVMSSMCSVHFDPPKRYSAYDKRDNLIYSGMASDTSFPCGTRIYISGTLPWYSSISSEGLDALGDFSSGVYAYIYGDYHDKRGKAHSASGYLVNDLNVDFVTGSNPFTAKGTIRSGYNVNYINLTSCTSTQIVPSYTILKEYSAKTSSPYDYTSTEPCIVTTYLNNPLLSGIRDMECTYTLSATVNSSIYDCSARFYHKWPKSASNSGGATELIVRYNKFDPSGILTASAKTTYSSYRTWWESGLITGYSSESHIARQNLTAGVIITGVAP
jgi:hypothetical protein